MFKNTFQSGFLSILYSIGSKPLQIWDKEGAYLVLLSCALSLLAHVASHDALFGVVQLGT
jgi:hypothetical protein